MKKSTILVVDDELFFRRLYAEILGEDDEVGAGAVERLAQPAPEKRETSSSHHTRCGLLVAIAALWPVCRIPRVDFPHAIGHAHHSIWEARDTRWRSSYEKISLGDRGRHSGNAAMSLHRLMVLAGQASYAAQKIVGRLAFWVYIVRPHNGHGKRRGIPAMADDARRMTKPTTRARLLNQGIVEGKRHWQKVILKGYEPVGPVYRCQRGVCLRAL